MHVCVTNKMIDQDSDLDTQASFGLIHIVFVCCSSGKLSLMSMVSTQQVPTTVTVIFSSRESMSTIMRPQVSSSSRHIT